VKVGRQPRGVDGIVTRVLAVVVAACVLAAPAAAGVHVAFPTSDGGRIVGDLYGTAVQGVVLAHGGRFNKESWQPQARILASAGFRVLAIDFRGYGESRGPGQRDPLSAPLKLDVLAAVDYLRATGVKKVSVIGASMGGEAAGDAAIIAQRPYSLDAVMLRA